MTIMLSGSLVCGSCLAFASDDGGSSASRGNVWNSMWQSMSEVSVGTEDQDYDQEDSAQQEEPQVHDGLWGNILNSSWAGEGAENSDQESGSLLSGESDSGESTDGQEGGSDSLLSGEPDSGESFDGQESGSDSLLSGESDSGETSDDQAPASEDHEGDSDGQESTSGILGMNTDSAEAGGEGQGTGSGAQSATIMIYMNGSNLESRYGSATDDIAEMLRAGCGSNVNVIIETLGTKRWHNYDIASDTAQRWRVNGSELELVQDHLGQLDTTAEETLSDFIGWSAANYPADRYILLMWDHGGGAVYGYGYDEWQSQEASLTLDEIRGALEQHSDVHFDFIGMDACLMSSLEVCMVLTPYCDYSVLSEDFESGIGWYYTDWMKKLEADPGIGTVELGKVIVDTMLAANQADHINGDETTLAVIDESRVEELFQAWVNFAYANEDVLLGKNYSTERHSKGRVLPLAVSALRYDGGSSDAYTDDYDFSDYYVTDIMAVASNTGGEGTEELETALSGAVAYMDSSSAETLTGIGVTLPYGDSYFYEEMQRIFSNCALDADYIEWLQKFVYADGSGNFYDYNEWYENWGGWSSFYAQLQESSSENAAGGWVSESTGNGPHIVEDSSDGSGQPDQISPDGSSSCSQDSDEDYYEDNPGSYEEPHSSGGGWYESLYECYGDEYEPYDVWYNSWFSEWKNAVGKD